MKTTFFTVFFLTTVLTGASSAAAPPADREVLDAVKKTSSFMMKTVSTNGGFVWQYSADLSERWGEVPARDTQIWVQGATNGVGDMFLDAYDSTGDAVFLDYAKRAANAIIWGQHPSGGWHYLIDFDMPGIQKWYDETASKSWGWEEYYHYYGNCTYDNDATTSSIRLLLRVYMTTLDPAYRTPLIRGLEFVLESQYPNGAWPQRYPLCYEFVKDGYPDYTSFYTFNDGVARNNIMLLLDAWDKLGDERYLGAASRGMDFYLTAAGPEGQTAWAEQYDDSIRPAQARTYEPGAYHSSRTAACIRELLDFYCITGDRRYLAPIPDALVWLEKSVINTDPSKKAERAGSQYSYTHAVYYEVGSNRPLYVHCVGSDIDNGRYWADYTFGDCPCHVLQVVSIDVRPLRRRYERISALTPKEARAEYRKRSQSRTARHPDPDAVRKILDSLDSRGAWMTDLTIRNYSNPCDFSGERTIRGISTDVFLDNMRILLDYLKNVRE